MILFGIGILALIYRLVVIVFPGIRNLLIRRRTDRRYIESLNYVLHSSGMSYADWFVLKKLNDNINTIRFGELCEGIKAELRKSSVEGRLSPSSPLPAYTTDSDNDKSFFDDNIGNGEMNGFMKNKDIE